MVMPTRSRTRESLAEPVQDVALVDVNESSCIQSQPSAKGSRKRRQTRGNRKAQKKRRRKRGPTTPSLTSQVCQSSNDVVVTDNAEGEDLAEGEGDASRVAENHVDQRRAGSESDPDQDSRARALEVCEESKNSEEESSESVQAHGTTNNEPPLSSGSDEALGGEEVSNETTISSPMDVSINPHLPASEPLSTSDNGADVLSTVTGLQRPSEDFGPLSRSQNEDICSAAIPRAFGISTTARAHSSATTGFVFRVTDYCHAMDACLVEWKHESRDVAPPYEPSWCDLASLVRDGHGAQCRLVMNWKEKPEGLSLTQYRKKYRLTKVNRVAGASSEGLCMFRALQLAAAVQGRMDEVPEELLDKFIETYCVRHGRSTDAVLDGLNTKYIVSFARLLMREGKKLSYNVFKKNVMGGTAIHWLEGLAAFPLDEGYYVVAINHPSLEELIGHAIVLHVEEKKREVLDKFKLEDGIPKYVRFPLMELENVGSIVFIRKVTFLD